MTSVSSDESYNDIIQMPISVTLMDDDVAGVDLGVDNSVPVELAEGASGRTLSVKLTSRPMSRVRLIITTGTQIIVSPSEMFFTSTNYTEVRSTLFRF
jgi:hypothetical protein